MKFLYCKECDNLRPRGWIIFVKRCEKCHYEMEKFNVKMTAIAPFYYASLVALVAVLIMYLSDWVLPFGTMSVVLVLVLTMVLAFLDYNLSFTYAKEEIGKGSEKNKIQ